MEGSAEVKFAQKLASNEKKTRDRAIKRLKKYLSLKSSRGAGLSDDDLLKIWKGLYYCMWMQDKSLVQEELSARITGLVSAFPKTADSLGFIRVFFATMAREWHGIDKFRLDKYLMMIRDMLAATFQLMTSASWSLDNCQILANVIETKVMNPQDTRLPDGLRLHLADMVMTELGKVNTHRLKMDGLLTLTLPFLRYVVSCPKINLVQRVMSGVITEMLEFIQTRKNKKPDEKNDTESQEKENGEEDMEVESSPAPGSAKAISIILTHMFKMSKKPGVRAANRAVVYKLIKLYPQVLATLGLDKVEDENDDDQLSKVFQEDEQATDQSVETPKKSRKRKRKFKEDDEENSIENNDSEVASSSKRVKISIEDCENSNKNTSLTPIKKSKKSKKQKLNLDIDSSDLLESKITESVCDKSISDSSDELTTKTKKVTDGKKKKVSDSILNDSLNNTSKSDKKKPKDIKLTSPNLVSPLSDKVELVVVYPQHTTTPSPPATPTSPSQTDVSVGSSSVPQSPPSEGPPTPMPPNTPSSVNPPEFVMTPGGSKKSLVFDLRKNKAQKWSDYITSLKAPPTPPAFTPTKVPATKGILRSPSMEVMNDAELRAALTPKIVKKKVRGRRASQSPTVKRSMYAKQKANRSRSASPAQVKRRKHFK